MLYLLLLTHEINSIHPLSPIRGGKGSHRIYVKSGVFEILNFQNVKGMAKQYQVRQFLNVVDKYNLKIEE